MRTRKSTKIPVEFLIIENMLNCNTIKNDVSLYTKTVDHNNVCFHFETSKCFYQIDLHKSTFKCIQRWLCLLIDNNKHLDMSYDFIKKVLSFSELDTTSEIELINFVDSWVNHDTTQRSKFAMSLLRNVRLSLLSNAALYKLLADDNSFSKRSDCKNYIEKTITNKKAKSNDPSCIDSQNRYCSQKEEFDIILGGKTSSNTFNVYKLDEQRISDETVIIEKLGRNSVNHITFINGIIYFFSSKAVYSYSVITKQVNVVSFSENIEGYYSHYSAFCSFMGKVYIIGRADVSRCCTTFDPKTNTWEEKPKMRVNRIGPACTVFCGKIVVSGGRERMASVGGANTVEV